MKVLCSIVIVNYNTRDLVETCLMALKALPDLADAPYEIIVIDNGSSDGSRDFLSSYEDEVCTVTLSTENRGFAAGCNLGIAQASGRYILLLNTDAFPQAGAIKLLISSLENQADSGIAGPQLLFPDGRWQRSIGMTLSPRTAWYEAMGLTSLRHVLAMGLWRLTGQWWHSRSVQYVDGACMLIRQEVVQAIGGLDERYFFFVEDAEFCARARAKGWQIRYVPQSHVIHLRGGSSSRKDHVRTVQARIRSEKIFVLNTQGEDAWRHFVFWRRVNFWWRMQLALLAGHRERYTLYNAAYKSYGEATA